MAGFTQQELEEMARADAEIEAEFRDWVPVEVPGRTSDLVWVSRLARYHHTTYGKFVATHSQEEIQAMVEQCERGEADEVSL